MQTQQSVIAFSSLSPRESSSCRLQLNFKVASGNVIVASACITRKHTELATTSRYSHVTQDDLRAAMEASEAAQTAPKVAAPEASENMK
jgi:pantothenate synthetase